jgi:hypothetical protein
MLGKRMNNYEEIRHKIRNEYSIEHIIAIINKAVIELKARDNYFYYTYSPVRSNTTKYLDLHKCTAKFIAARGSPRSGKSYAIIQKCNQLLLDEDPYDHLKGNHPYLMWAVASSFKKVKDQLFPLFKRLVPMNRVKRIIEKTNSNEYSIEYDNDSRIVFKSQEEKIDEFKSADVHIIMADERIESEKIRENLRHRIITTDGRIFYTMDSLGDDDWLDEMEKLSYAKVFTFCLEDNKDYIPSAEFERLQKEGTNEQRERLLFGKPVNENHKRIFLDEIFNDTNYQEIVPKRYNVEGNELRECENGILSVFKDREDGRKYVIGYDSAAGTGGNANCLQVFSDDGEQIARVLNNNIHFTLLPNIIIDILNYYNRALFVPENEMHAIFVANTVAEKYFNVYIDEIVKDPSRYQKVDWGIKTNEVNKREMCDKTLADLKTRLLLHDSKTVRQLKGFIEDYSGDTQKKSPKLHGTKIKDDEELKGSDDDLVIGLFLADRALNKYNYFNNAKRRKLPEEKRILSVDDLMNVKIIRYGHNGMIIR